MNYVKTEIGCTIVDKMNRDEWLYIRNISDEASERRNNSRAIHSFSIIDTRRPIRIMIPAYHDEVTSISSMSIKTNQVTNTSIYKAKSNILRGFEF